MIYKDFRPEKLTPKNEVKIVIKLNNISTEIMDKIMPICRATNNKPEVVIKAILKHVSYDDAMRAVKNEQEEKE